MITHVAPVWRKTDHYELPIAHHTCAPISELSSTISTMSHTIYGDVFDEYSQQVHQEFILDGKQEI